MSRAASCVIAKTQNYPNVHQLGNGYYLAKKKMKLSTDKCYNVDEPKKHYGTEKRPVTKDHILYYPICVKWNLNRQIYRNR